MVHADGFDYLELGRHVVNGELYNVISISTELLEPKVSYQRTCPRTHIYPREMEVEYPKVEMAKCSQPKPHRRGSMKLLCPFELLAIALAIARQRLVQKPVERYM